MEFVVLNHFSFSFFPFRGLPNFVAGPRILVKFSIDNSLNGVDLFEIRAGNVDNSVEHSFVKVVDVAARNVEQQHFVFNCAHVENPSKIAGSFFLVHNIKHFAHHGIKMFTLQLRREGVAAVQNLPRQRNHVCKPAAAFEDHKRAQSINVPHCKLSRLQALAATRNHELDRTDFGRVLKKMVELVDII